MGRRARSTDAPRACGDPSRLGLLGDPPSTWTHRVSPRSRRPQLGQRADEGGYQLRSYIGDRLGRLHGDRAGDRSTTVEPMSEPGVRLVGSAFVSFAGTTAIFYVLHTHQPMVFVAAFMTAIGVLPTIQSLVVAVTAALLMAGIQAARRQYGPEFSSSQDQTNAWSFET